MQEKKIRIPFLLFPYGDMRIMGQKMRRLGRALVKAKPEVGKQLRALEIDVEPYEYAVGCFMSAFVYGFVFSGLVYIILRLTDPEIGIFALLLSSVLGAVIMLMFFLLHMMHPGMIEKKIVEKENKDLLFALREIINSTDSGVTLFDSMKHIATGDYGHVSRDFEIVVKKMEAGKIEKKVLRDLAIESENPYLRRAAWQIVTSLETGSRVGTALTTITDLLERYLYREIRDYSSNINFLTLIYTLVAAAIPSIGITFVVILGSIGGAAIDMSTIIMLLSGVFITEILIIGYASSTRPEIFGG